MKILVRSSYVGTNFAGFQVQPNARTVQGALCEAAKSAFGEECDVTGCSRTDAGVHARGFVCAISPHKRSGFGDEMTIPAGRVCRALGRYLPPDVAVTGAAIVPDSFHPRYDARGKEYRYVVYTGARDPFREGRALWRPKPFSPDEIKIAEKCAAALVGTHDFAAFKAAGSDVENTVRTVFSAKIEASSDIAEFTVSADGFLYNMVRIMVGTILDCAEGRLLPECIPVAFETKERSLLGRTAPPCGLYLESVAYDPPIEWQND